MPARDTSHLEWHGSQWRVIVAVPAKARRVIGKAHLKHPLSTGDLRLANILKHDHVGRFKRMISDALRPGSEPLDEARVIRATSGLAKAPDNDDLKAGIEVRAEQIAEAHGEVAARSYVDVALVRATPLDDHLEAFIGDWDYQPKSVLDLRRAVRRLGEWLKGRGLPVTVEAVTGEAAGDFMRHRMHVEGLSRKGAAKDLAFLRTYWGWMEDHRYRPAGTSPWTARLPKDKAKARHDDAAQDGGKRPYTDGELWKLLHADTPPEALAYPRELTTLAPLSGMRLEELYMLKVRDVEDGFYNIRIGKTKNAVRRVPIHTAARKLVQSLVKGKGPEDYLIDPEAPVVALTGIRSSAASKSFTRFRRALGIDERPNDKAKSNVDFHSFRRWFIKKAKDALDAGARGYTAWTIADVVGHDDDGMKDILRLTMSHYPGPSGDAARKACVEAVKLPV